MTPASNHRTLALLVSLAGGCQPDPGADDQPGAFEHVSEELVAH